MAGSDVHYRRLPGKGLRRQGFLAVARIYSTLWLAGDHLLNVDSNGFAEDYKRFYFRDIQALLVQKTRRGVTWSIILSIIAFIFMLAAFRAAGRAESEMMIVWAVNAGIFLIFLLLNLWRGPTCTCYIITAVQEEILPSLDRIKTAEKVIRTLRRTIKQAQENLSATEI